jgi:hypothetical protein
MFRKIGPAASHGILFGPSLTGACISNDLETLQSQPAMPSINS